MRSPIFRLLSLLCILVLFVLAACGGGATETEQAPTEAAAVEEDAPTTETEAEEEPTEEPTEEVEEEPTEEPTEAAEEEPTEDAAADEDEDSTISDGLERNDQGGFAFAVPDGWIVGTNEGVPGLGAFVVLVREGVDLEGGDEPEELIFMTTGESFIFDEEIGPDASPEELFDNLIAQFDPEQNIEVSNPEEITVGGESGLLGKFSGEDPDVGEVEGRVVVVVTEDERVLGIFAGAPADVWEQEAFDTVIDSIEFFEPVEADVEGLEGLEDLGEAPEDLGDEPFDELQTEEQGSFAIGEEVTGTIDDIFTAHSWTFDGTAGQVVTLSAVAAEGAETDPRLTLLDPDDVELASADDVGDGNVDAILEAFELPVDGTYTVLIDVFAEGDYVLTVVEGEGAPGDSGSDEGADADVAIPEPDGTLAFEGIPAFPDAEEAPEDDPFVLSVLEEAANPPEGFSSADARVFIVPTDVTFAQIEGFYTENLPAWDLATSEASEVPGELGEAMQELAVWTLEDEGMVFSATLTTNEALSELAGGNYLLLAVFSE